MPLSADDRATLIALLPALGDDADPRAAHAFAASHRQALLEELGAVPGMDQVRAAALRLLPVLEPAVEAREPHLVAAGEALLVPPGDHPAERMARHPAWIGLALLELADRRDDWEGDPVERALELAGRAFATFGSADEVGEGEVAWALAEEADEAGWSSRAHALLEAAVQRPFADPARRAQAVLVAAIRRDQRGGDAVALLGPLVDDEAAEDRTRTHAAWVLAHLHHRDGRADAARQVLARAAETVDRQADPEVAARIDATLAAWGA